MQGTDNHEDNIFNQKPYGQVDLAKHEKLKLWLENGHKHITLLVKFHSLRGSTQSTLQISGVCWIVLGKIPFV